MSNARPESPGEGRAVNVVIALNVRRVCAIEEFVDLLAFQPALAEARRCMKAPQITSPRAVLAGRSRVVRGLLAVLLGVIAAPDLRGEAVLFSRDVMAVLSKAGCNSGPCHGNANGKGGFKLSLRGDDPGFDFNALTRDQLARRATPLAPEESLLLLKPTAAIAHEGGKRFEKDSGLYRLLHDWIAGGLKADPPDAPKPARLEVAPANRILTAPENSVQISAYAVFSDGSRREVKSLAVYEPTSPLAKVTEDGLVTVEGEGEVTVLVRYLNLQATVHLAFVPARPDFRWARVPEHNYIDRHVFAKLRQLRMTPSDLCTDEVFVRRAFLDLLGIPPTAEEARAFVNDRSRSKRAQLVDALLERPEFAEFWAQKWMDLLRAEERSLDAKGVRVLYDWLRDRFARNQPLDAFAREIVAARGSTYENPPANFYRAIRDPTARAEAAAQVFLGVRLQCAQCHNHPFDRWTQDDYYRWAGLFARVDYKILENRRRDRNDKHEFDGEQIVFMARKGGVKDPRTGRAVQPQFLGAPASEWAEDADHLRATAAWLTDPANEMFARTQANRIWYHLMGRGLVEPIDDFRASNPPSHPELLAELTRDLVKSGFDLRHLVRRIMASRTYQLASEPNATNAADEINFSHALVRRLTAEQIMDAQSMATGVPLSLPGHPAGTRATQLPALPTERRMREDPDGMFQFMQVFGKPARLIPSECERSCEPTMGQAFQMISGPLLNDLLTHEHNRLSAQLASQRTDREITDDLYWSTLSRAPSEKELAAALAHVAKRGDRRTAFEDLLWGLLNAKEFVLRK
jgi:hypothetical protein